MRCFFDNTTDAWDFAMAMGASEEFKVTDYGYTHMGDDETGDQKTYVDIEWEIRRKRHEQHQEDI